MLSACLRPATAFRRAGADEIALHVRQSAEHANHQPSGAGGCVSPRLSQRPELPAHVHDLPDDGEQIEDRAREAVDAGLASVI